MTRRKFKRSMKGLKIKNRYAKASVPDTTPLEMIRRTDMNSIPKEVQDEIKDIMNLTIDKAGDVSINFIVKLKLAANFISTFADTIYYVNENEKEGKRTFKTIVKAFCEEHKLYAISICSKELLYNENGVKGVVGFDTCTDKTFSIDYMLDETVVDSFKEFVNRRENKNDTPILSRLSLDGRGYMDENNILFNAPKINMPSNVMYPSLNESPEELAVKFMESTANVLVLYGDPGTGKTTYIKRMLQGVGFTEGRSISVVDTPAVMNSPELVNKIYTSKHKDIFIFEDVDRHLYSRTEGNEIMAGLLNAAEGLASPDVKIIISTNIINLNDIDSALIRPGRCYDTVKFTKLSKEQQIHVREFLNLDVEVCTHETQSLAEVMNGPSSHPASTFGFS